MKQFIYLITLLFTLSCASINAQNYKTHKVKDGETIESIAKQYEEFFDSISLTMDDVLIFHSNANLNRKKGYYFFDYFFMECRRVLEKTNYKYGKIDYNVQKEKIYF